MNKFLLVLATLLSGSSFWLAGRAANDLPPRVDVNNRSLRMRVEGNGSPAVVLEIGLGGALEEWAAVQPHVARFTKVVAYDRIGGLDEQSVLTGTQIVRDLHASLRKSGIEPPYVLVGQSFGGIYNRIFASLFPNEVAGLVLLDPSQEEFIGWMQKHHPTKSLSRKEIVRWPEGAGIWATLDELKSVGPLPNVPIVVVTATRPSNDPLWIEVSPVWKKSHDDWVKSLPHARHVLAPESGHGVHVEASELVVDLIREVVNEARNRSGSDEAVATASGK
jgi:pimeloyl-ACP methyl ester carboxylesterase